MNPYDLLEVGGVRTADRIVEGNVTAVKCSNDVTQPLVAAALEHEERRALQQFAKVVHIVAQERREGKFEGETRLLGRAQLLQRGVGQEGQTGFVVIGSGALLLRVHRNKTPITRHRETSDVRMRVAPCNSQEQHDKARNELSDRPLQVHPNPASSLFTN